MYYFWMERQSQTCSSQTFKEYAEQVFMPYINRKIKSLCRIDIVWDEYIAYSLKEMTRSKRGKGVRWHVDPETRLPTNWQAFLRIDSNKAELFGYLAEKLVAADECQDKQIITTKWLAVLSNTPRETPDLSLCNHEEADTKLLLHAADAAKQGYKKIMIQTVDTDVVVLAVSMVQDIDVNELLVSIGVGKHLRYLAVHEISNSLGKNKSRALQGFHAFTGCDQTSAFAAKGEKTAWETWKSLDDVTSAF